MMLLHIVAVGKIRSRAIAELCAGFGKRLGAYSRLKLTEIPDSDPGGEGRAICRELDRERGARVVVLSEEGRLFSTAEFADFLRRCDTKVVLVVGGPFGLSPSGGQGAGGAVMVAVAAHIHPRAGPAAAAGATLPGAELQCRRRLPSPLISDPATLRASGARLRSAASLPAERGLPAASAARRWRTSPTSKAGRRASAALLHAKKRPVWGGKRRVGQCGRPTASTAYLPITSR